MTAETLKNLLARFHKKNDYESSFHWNCSARRQTENDLQYRTWIDSGYLTAGRRDRNYEHHAGKCQRTDSRDRYQKSTGAKKRDIIVQFLSETLMLTLVGGLLGIALGRQFHISSRDLADMPTVVTASALILSFGISAMVGITFGIYPAWRAANMDPIESLRHE